MSNTESAGAGAADLHCDVVSKLLQNPGQTWEDAQDRLDVTIPRLLEGNVRLQVFAIYVPQALPNDPETVLQAAERYWSAVAAAPELQAVTGRADLASARQSGKIAALLSLEGADGLQGKLWVLRLLHRLGLRLLGPTWNGSNWACDGAMEPRGGGLTKAGRELIAACEGLGILLDVSHLSDRGFWDLAEIAEKPFFASHSNARAVLPHARNLDDEQIRAILGRDGIVGVTFVPWFLSRGDTVTIDDVLRHVEHICGLGGERQLAFGSDFDGIDRHVDGLAHPGCYPALAEALAKRYSDDQVRGFLGGNAWRFFEKNLSS